MHAGRSATSTGLRGRKHHMVDSPPGDHLRSRGEVLSNRRPGFSSDRQKPGGKRKKSAVRVRHRPEGKKKSAVQHRQRPLGKKKKSAALLKSELYT